MDPNSLNIHERMIAYADEPSNHMALMKMLVRKKLLTKADLKFYLAERSTAKEHLVLLSSMLALAAGAARAGSKAEDIAELATEMGIESLAEARGRALEALDYLYFTDEEREQIGGLIDGLVPAEDGDN